MALGCFAQSADIFGLLAPETPVAPGAVLLLVEPVLLENQHEEWLFPVVAAVRNTRLLLGTFCIFACCRGLVVEIPTKLLLFFSPLPTSTKNRPTVLSCVCYLQSKRLRTVGPDVKEVQGTVHQIPSQPSLYKDHAPAARIRRTVAMGVSSILASCGRLAQLCCLFQMLGGFVMWTC